MFHAEGDAWQSSPCKICLMHQHVPGEEQEDRIWDKLSNQQWKELLPGMLFRFGISCSCKWRMFTELDWKISIFHWSGKIIGGYLVNN